MATLQEVTCCGIRELDGVQGRPAHDTIVDDANEYFGDDAERAHIFFSVIGNYALSGRALAAYITKNRLGTVIRTKRAVNGNTGNPLIMYVWTVNKTTFKRFWKKFGDYDPDYNY